MDVFLYVPKNTAIHRLDPRTKLLSLLALLIALVPLDHPKFQVPIALALAGLIAWSGAYASFRRLRTLIFTITFFSFLMWSLLSKGETHLWGPIYLEGLLFGLGTGLRLGNMVTASVVFLSTTRNEEMSTALARLGVPFPVVFAFSTALRLVPTFIGAGATIIQAQRSRGLEVETGSVATRIRKYVPLLIPVIATAVRSTNNFAMALESKGFGAQKQRTYFLHLQMSPVDWLLTIAAFAALVGAMLARYVYGFGGIAGLIR